MFLLDTDVVSRTSPFSKQRDEVQSWLGMHERESFLSVLTLSELGRGTILLRMKGASTKAARLEAWIDEVEASVSGRLLAVDRNIGRRTGEMLARAEAAGHRPSFVDACLAATAAERGFTVMTFNAKHFAAFGVAHRKPSPGGEP